MKNIKLTYALVALFAYSIAQSFTNEAVAQELNCTVVLNSDQLFAQQNTDAANLSQLKNVITDFMNARRWTSDNYTPEERINCRLNINLLRSVSQGSYEANAQLIVLRPVFGSTYETVVFSYVDRNFNFNYLPNNPMYFNENNYTDELTHTLAFYAYLILAADYDSFSKLGGNPHVQRAFLLSNMALAAGAKGWVSSDNTLRNRYWLVENLMDQQLTPFREGMYNYHRLALDAFAQNPVAARKQVMNVLTTIQQVNLLKPVSVLVNSFFDAKGQEIYKIMREAPKDERQKVFNMLSQLDPTQTELYRKLLK
ncbi:MAG: DUF4835 family protein [Runella slithyformis]|nr:MAG: DUF4835 family protein [Runella slithyformis]TAE91372.1 MAG: DUF4835 family protein [Runella slithyformis]TAF23722.1 MAG: DUF4835 family protein [Runella slithyformis]TAF49266.1 MAG: DUF4835 family protein [Runella slithyformis]TAF78926.1 MAG: DUF4835 family protein [Runella slithyformis]